MVLGGTPLVYPCNNHGTARKDGTCECDVDEALGTGYDPDDLVFDHDNCYGTVLCHTPQVCFLPNT